MFMQIIQGRCADQDAARATMDRWVTELGPRAEGWLGGTYGFTDDGMLIAAVRFENEAAARANSQRPEQGAWWEEMRRHFTEEPTFHDCDNALLLLGGGADNAGFVQVIQGTVRDPERAMELARRSETMLSTHRPDVLGATIAVDRDGCFTETVAFRTETEARIAEKREMPADAAQLVEEEMSLLSDVHYYDLHHPWFTSAR